METIKHTQSNHQCHGGYGHASHGDAADDVDGMGALLGEEIPTGYVERQVHGVAVKGSGLFLEQFVDMVDIVERVVDEKPQLRYDAQLVSHLGAQLVAYGLLVGIDIVDDFLTLL